LSQRCWASKGSPPTLAHNSSSSPAPATYSYPTVFPLSLVDRGTSSPPVPTHLEAERQMTGVYDGLSAIWGGSDVEGWTKNGRRGTCISGRGRLDV
jgi:hypothetical protein